MNDDRQGERLGRASDLGRSLEVIGPRWALLIVQVLLDRPCRFKDLTERLPGISTNLLSERLRGLEHAGVIRRSIGEPPRSVVTYDLTASGRKLEPTITSLRAWATQLAKPAD